MVDRGNVFGKAMAVKKYKAKIKGIDGNVEEYISEVDLKKALGQYITAKFKVEGGKRIITDFKVNSSTEIARAKEGL
ncbi:hypothetical protein SAMN04488698_11064 [Candidatus Frackibacter sp. WG12]|nr:MAG: hypothetical protein AWU54_1663 [Candidatus Frackibacter sp. T328-2]SDC45000.1 hypothetical protein SAMN04515661_11063 [Candidatus Frackibacter sp. WG11]SEM64937.1 hypothetical protein SAMN04488698_11064 [Candidatus Frackibacter sp. WG12]SFL67503.1 hypothetical protein SAMN04488699_10927 [Candidatus Frackibacter sp. WG13]